MVVSSSFSWRIKSGTSRNDEEGLSDECNIARSVLTFVVRDQEQLEISLASAICNDVS